MEISELLDGGIFTGLLSLTKLTIQGCREIVKIDRDTFTNMPNLEWIHLIFNVIGSIEPGAFQTTRNFILQTKAVSTIA
jgi:hypothetical protein